VTDNGARVGESKARPNGESGPPVFHTFGPLRWWGYTREHSPHRHVELRFWRFDLHVEAWVNRYSLSTSRVCFRVGTFYDRKRGSGYAAQNGGTGQPDSGSTAGQSDG
jgi:hypothetical protein